MPLLGRARRGGGPLALRLHGGVRLLAELGGTAASRPVAMARGAAAAPRLQCDVTVVGADQAYRQRFERTLRAFDGGLPLLIQGETGSGKEVAARALHAASRRGQGSFVALNCAALSPQLMAAELFGHVDGAFTGARRGGRVGHIEAAHGGTLLLDEIGDMPLELQVGLLRVLDRREVVALGDTRARQVDVQFVCATHRDLDDLVRAGRFREDLLHRLRGCVLRVPALRERADIGQLLDRLLSDAGASPDRLPTAVRNRLLAYAWPGNVRELRHAVRLAVAVSGDGDALAWEDFSLGVRRVLDQVRRDHADQNVLLVSSGGPISTAVGEVLGTAPEVTIALNMRIRNSAVTEFSVSPKRLMLQTFNTLPHLHAQEHQALITHA